MRKADSLTSGSNMTEETIAMEKRMRETATPTSDTPITDKIIADADATPETRIVFLIKHLANQSKAFERQLAEKNALLDRMEAKIDAHLAARSHSAPPERPEDQDFSIFAEANAMTEAAVSARATPASPAESASLKEKL